jgi:hypothetical protein
MTTSHTQVKTTKILKCRSSWSGRAVRHFDEYSLNTLP